MEMNGLESPRKMTHYSLDDVSKHSAVDDMWMVINNKVYDVTQWARLHPGGAKILGHYAGHDATDAWMAVHSNKDLVMRYMGTYYIGDLSPVPQLGAAMQEYRELRVTVERLNLYRANPVYYSLFLAQIILLELSSFLVLRYYGNDWLPWLLAAVLFTTAQAQAGWLQHDFGHMAVFRNNRFNHLAHHLLNGFFKGASSHWWNFRHQQHHVKPNVVKKDPDIDVPYLFLLGRVLPRDWGLRKRGFMPYNRQHHYFFLFGPPLLLPLYFHFEVTYFIFKRRDWLDLALLIGFFVRFFYIFASPLGGIMPAFVFYMFVRMLESHWFVWCTQMNHIPMKVDRDGHSDWLRMQLAASCDVQPGWFNDWFSGHLNYQIEHHLFPTMPSHNYPLVQPLVKSLCDKHGIDYVCRTSLWQAWVHIVRSLKESGEIWYEAYHSLG